MPALFLMSLSFEHLVFSSLLRWTGKNGSWEGFKRTRKQVEGDSETRVYDKVTPRGLQSCLLTWVSLCHWFCGCKQVSAMSAHLHLCAYVGVRACGLSTLPDWRLGFCFKTLPAACEVLPSMVLVFRLIPPAGHGSHVCSSGLAWGAFPACGPNLCHIQGRCVKVHYTDMRFRNNNEKIV